MIINLALFRQPASAGLIARVPTYAPLEAGPPEGIGGTKAPHRRWERGEDFDETNPHSSSGRASAPVCSIGNGETKPPPPEITFDSPAIHARHFGKTKYPFLRKRNQGLAEVFPRRLVCCRLASSTYRHGRACSDRR